MQCRKEGVFSGCTKNCIGREGAACKRACFAYHSAERLKQAKNELAKCPRELGKWEELMLSSVEGACVFTPEQIKRRMDTLQEKATTLSDEIQTLQQKASVAERTAQEILQQHRQLLSWADLFVDASTDEKKMVAANLLRAVKISRDYGIEVEFNISEAQYLNGLEMGY